MAYNELATYQMIARHVLWLESKLGKGFYLKSSLLLPNTDFFPFEITPTEECVDRIVTTLRNHLHSSETFKCKLLSQKQEQEIEQFLTQEQEDRNLVFLESLTPPKTFLASMVHMVLGEVMAEKHLTDPPSDFPKEYIDALNAGPTMPELPDEDLDFSQIPAASDEPGLYEMASYRLSVEIDIRTSIFSIFSGTGILTANGALETKQEYGVLHSKRETWSTGVRFGSLPEFVLGTSLAVYAQLMDDTRLEWLKYCDPGVVKAIQGTRKDLAENPKLLIQLGL